MIVTFMVLCLLLAGAFYTRISLWATLAHQEHRARLFYRISVASLVVRFAVLAAAVIGIVIALTRPQTHAPVTSRDKTRHLMVMLDISRSMLAQDAKPHRLSQAREKIKALVSQLNADAVGLLVFAGSAYVVCPFTHDHQTLFSFLDDIDEHTISASSTSYREALTLVKKKYDELEQHPYKLALLVTDGEDFSDIPADFYDTFKKSSIFLATLGVGTVQGAPIPEGKGFVHDSSGSVVITQRNDACLQDIAARCAGVYVPVDIYQNKDIETLQQWIEHFERYQVSETELTEQPIEWYAYPAGLAVCLLLGEWLL